MAARRSKKDTAEELKPIGRSEVCPEHFPGGVPAGTATVGCEHGTYRIAPEEPEDPPTDPAPDPPTDPDQGQGQGEGGDGGEKK